jgi:hypothetical protein
MPEIAYRRLTRPRSRARFGLVSTARVSLWLAPDHLLQVDSNGYSESYKRFQFRDIEALVVCRTDEWLYRSVILGALAAFFGLIAVFGGGQVVAWIFGSLSGLFVLVLMLNLIAGPSSKAYLRTAVQTERLPSLNRMRRAQKVLALLRPLILAAQADLMPKVAAAVPPEAADRPVAPQSDATAPEQPAPLEQPPAPEAT